nr:TraM recognition domain-containing protein [Mycoplasmopsis agalactiae]
MTILLETNSDETLKSISTTLGDKEVKKESISKQSDSNKQTVSTSESKEAVMSIAQLNIKIRIWQLFLLVEVNQLL